MVVGNAPSEACTEFRVKYVGALEQLHFDMSRALQEPLDLINYIDAAQVGDPPGTDKTKVNRYNTS